MVLTSAYKYLHWTTTVLQDLIGEYHSSSAAQGLQCLDVTKQLLVSDWSTTPELLWCQMSLCSKQRKVAVSTVLYIPSRSVAPFVGPDGTASVVCFVGPDGTASGVCFVGPDGTASVAPFVGPDGTV